MGLFKRLFGKTTEDKIVSRSPVALTPDQFLQSDYVKNILGKYEKKAFVLNPIKRDRPISSSESKFGGKPNLNSFAVYPCCDKCGVPLNFVLQLYKKDFSEHYWPGEKNLFQLFRCPNGKCPAAYAEPFYSDHKMFVYYFKCDEGANAEIEMPFQSATEESEQPVPDCSLNPKLTPDFPQYDDFEGAIAEVEHKFGEEFGELFMDEFHASGHTKSGGYPGFTQPAYYPQCQCGKRKDFFFQLSSDDTPPHITNPQYNEWSPHGIMIGDVGNIYFYVCKNCGESSIESYWDCY